jgi:integrase
MARKKANYKKGEYTYHRIRETFGKKPDGTPNRKEFTGKTYAEAKAKRDAYARLYEAGLHANLSKMPCGEAMRMWLFNVKRPDANLRPSSFERYEAIFRNHIAPFPIANIRVADAASMDISRHLIALFNAGGSYSQIKNAVKILRMFFKYAREEGYTAKDPLRKIIIPGEKPAKNPPEIFKKEELEKIKEEMARSNYRYTFLVLLALGTGLRQGELLALRYKDVEESTIQVTQALSVSTHIDGEGKRIRVVKVDKTKTDSSIRTVPIPASLMHAFRQHKKQQMEEYMRLGLGRPEYVFTTDTGNLLDPRNVLRSFTRLLDRAGVEHKKFHSLRHTFASTLVAAGVPLPVVKDLMGHSNIATTMIYVHMQLNDKRKAVAFMDQLVSEAK